jgi:thymidylate synthase (FAD)
MVIEVQAPIFVFREWHRHRTQSYNEMSARYAPLPDLYYTPSTQDVIDRALLQGVNKQANSVTVPDPGILERIPAWLETVEHAYHQLEEIYQQALAAGIPKELARITMPVGHYSRMHASANLRNWLAFMTLRCAPVAQKEIRQYAEAVGKIIEATFPQTYNLWFEEVHRV